MQCEKALVIPETHRNKANSYGMYARLNYYQGIYLCRFEREGELMAGFPCTLHADGLEAQVDVRMRLANAKLVASIKKINYN